MQIVTFKYGSEPIKIHLRSPPTIYICAQPHAVYVTKTRTLSYAKMQAQTRFPLTNIKAPIHTQYNCQ